MQQIFRPLPVAVFRKYGNMEKHVSSFWSIWLGALVSIMSYEHVLCYMKFKRHREICSREAGQLVRRSTVAWRCFADNSIIFCPIPAFRLFEFTRQWDSLFFDAQILSRSDLQSRLPFDAVREAAPLDPHRWLPCSLVSFYVIPKTSADL